MNIADALSRHADGAPYRVAIVDGDRVIHYRSLDAAIWRAAGWLAGSGLRPGDRVAFSAAANSALWLVAAYALARMGVAFLPLDPLDAPGFREALARRLGLVAVLGDGPAARLGSLPLLQPQLAWLEGGPAAPEPRLRAEGEDAPVMILLSSGTTRAPKAMVRTHREHVLSSLADRPRAVEGAEDRLLALTSFRFSYGLCEAMQTLDGGGTVRIPPQPMTFAALCEILDRESITRLALTPMGAQQLLARLPETGPRFPGIRDLTLATTFAPPALLDEIRRRITPGIVIAYGSNEALCATWADAAMLLRFPGTVGVPYGGVVIEIVDDAGRVLAPGEAGLVRMRGPGFARGYIDDPEATARAFRDGWYYPGDLGVLSPAGALFLKGRADDMINFDGIKVYPADIEAALQGHPAVEEAAAFPVIVQGYRQIPVAAVILRGTATADELMAFCRPLLGPRSPRAVYVLDGFPRNAIGKVLKRALAERFSPGREDLPTASAPQPR